MLYFIIKSDLYNYLGVIENHIAITFLGRINFLLISTYFCQSDENNFYLSYSYSANWF